MAAVRAPPVCIFDLSEESVGGLLPYIRLGFKVRTTSGRGMMCAMYALEGSVKAARGLLPHDSPAPDITLQDIQQMHLSAEYFAEGERMIQMKDEVFRDTLRQDIRHASYLDMSALEVLLAMINQRLSTNFQLGVVRSHKPSARGKWQHSVLEMGQHLYPRDDTRPIVYVHSMTKSAYTKGGIPYGASGHWEIFALDEPRTEAALADNWHLEAAALIKAKSGMFIAKADISRQDPRNPILARKGTFLYAIEDEDLTRRTIHVYVAGDMNKVPHEVEQHLMYRIDESNPGRLIEWSASAAQVQVPPVLPVLPVSPGQTAVVAEAERLAAASAVTAAAVSAEATKIAAAAASMENERIAAATAAAELALVANAALAAVGNNAAARTPSATARERVASAIEERYQRDEAQLIKWLHHPREARYLNAISQDLGFGEVKFSNRERVIDAIVQMIRANIPPLEYMPRIFAGRWQDEVNRLQRKGTNVLLSDSRLRRHPRQTRRDQQPRDKSMLIRKHMVWKAYAALTWRAQSEAFRQSAAW